MEDLGVESEKTFDRPRKKRFFHSIREQVEFYLGDVNLSKDRFFAKLLEESPYVDIEIILKCNKIKKLTTNPKDVVTALKKSSLLSVTQDESKVYRTVPVSPIANADDCTVYVEDLPMEADHEWLKNVFGVYGEVVYVSVPTYRTTHKVKGFAFIQFESPECAKSAIEAFRSVNSCLSCSMESTKLRSIQTFEGEKDVIVREHQPVHVENIKSVRTRRTTETEDEEGKEHQPVPVENIKSVKTRRTTETEDEEGKEHQPVPVENIKSVRTRRTTETEYEEGEPQRKKRKRNKDDSISKDSAEEREKPEKENVKEQVSQKRADDAEERVKTEKENVKEHVSQKCADEMEADDAENIQSETEENAAANSDSRKSRKKKRKKPKRLEQVQTYGMHIMSKKDWKKLRNKYLEEQRKRMHELKQQLRIASTREYEKHQLDTKSDDNEDENSTTKTSLPLGSRVTYTPGVIVKLPLDQFIKDVRSFKNEVKRYADVEYIDVKENDSVAFIRCSSNEAANQLIALNKWQNMLILQGNEELAYWEKIKLDRKEKIENKIRPKTRGKNKLLKKVEAALATHIKFPD